MEWNQVHGRWTLAWGVILLLGWNQPGWTQDASPPSKLVNGGLEDRRDRIVRSALGGEAAGMTRLAFVVSMFNRRTKHVAPASSG